MVYLCCLWITLAACGVRTGEQLGDVCPWVAGQLVSPTLTWGVPLQKCNSSASPEAIKLERDRAISPLTGAPQARREHLHVISGHTGYVLFSRPRAGLSFNCLTLLTLQCLTETSLSFQTTPPPHSVSGPQGVMFS